MEYVEQVTSMAREGRHLTEIEDTIDHLPGLSDDERAALWLVAWTYQSRARQRYELKQTVRLMNARAAAEVPTMLTVD